MIMTQSLFFLKVGEEEEKLAEGIKLHAISATPTSKRTMLSDLITVRAALAKLCFILT